MPNRILIENPFLAVWRNPTLLEPMGSIETGRPPEGVTSGAPPDVYHAYRRGCDSACVDVVIGTVDEQGTAMVLLSERKPDVCYGGMWWMHGGALPAYHDIDEFAAMRTERECGVHPESFVLVGVYRTCAFDRIGSTLQPCYATKVDIKVIRDRMRRDEGHGGVRLFTWRDYLELPEKVQHWYPRRVAGLVLRSIPGATRR